MKLTIELVPKTCWMSNVRSHVSKNEWDRLRKECYRTANHKCEICGGRGPRWPVECHEVWHYDDTNKIQKLERLIALCTACHQVKHAGRSHMLGLEQQVIKQLCKVNKMSQQEANAYLVESFKKWSQRSQYQWTIDISYLIDKGININA